MNITITNTQTDLPIDEKQARTIVREALLLMNVECMEISFQFVSKKDITTLHADFFDDPTPTDCITFPIDPPGPDALLGEVFVCPKTAIEYVANQGGNVEEETILYICHGILHLLGFDDIDDKDRQEMRKNESFLIENLRKKGLLQIRKV